MTVDPVSAQGHRVRVEGRDDIGVVIQAGKNMGTPSNNIYAYVKTRHGQDRCEGHQRLRRRGYEGL